MKNSASDIPVSNTDLTPPYIASLTDQHDAGKQTGLVSKAGAWLKSTTNGAMQTLALPKAFVPLAKLFTHNQPVTDADLAYAIDLIFNTLTQHPLTLGSRKITGFLRNNSILPNEHTTEDLIRFIINQSVARSPVPVPEPVLNEFWGFFDELFGTPELKGLVEVNLEAGRFVLKTYEPMLVELINSLKEVREFNAEQLGHITKRTKVLQEDLAIMKRQVKALRYIKPFFQADPKDFTTQAELVVQMVGEFGPFFIKLAQVAAANADFLPDEIAKELERFQEEVPPMSADEVTAAFVEAFGKQPHEMYFGFDVHKPLKSGSIGSVYLARKPVKRVIDGEVREELEQVIVKVARYNLDREFQMGRLVLGLAIISSQYWAPHSKLEPFLRAMQHQVSEFVDGFEQELDFEMEANIQNRFARRSRSSRVWKVPQINRASTRILEMEFLDNARSLASLNRKQSLFTRGWSRKRQRRIAQKLIYTVLHHAIVYQEMHGDLHPGNIMVSDDDDQLYLIDWGNVIDLHGKWRPVWEYVSSALIAEPEGLADALIAMSTDVEANQARRAEIIDMLRDTMQKKGIQPLDKRFVLQLWRGGLAGLQQRANTMAHMLSNAQQLDVVVRSEYMHLSRSLFAALGTYLSLYQAAPLPALADLASGVVLFPLNYGRDRLQVKWQNRIDRMIYALPMPERMQKKLAYQPQRPALTYEA